jgi:hypothetical protein
MNIKFTAFWDVTCNSVERLQRFGGICCLHLQGRRVFCSENEGRPVFSLNVVVYETRRLHIPEDSDWVFLQSAITNTTARDFEVASDECN